MGSSYSIKTRRPVIVTMTTVPWRLDVTIRSVREILKLNVANVIVNIPRKYKRADMDPKWIVDEEKLNMFPKDRRLIINRSKDYGPITKIIPTLDTIKRKKAIVIILDDQIYYNRFIKKIAEEQDKAPRGTVHTYFHYDYKRLNVPQGVDMISFFSEDLRGLSYEDNDSCFLVDDLVIGNYISNMGYRLKKVERDGYKWVWIPTSPEEEGETLFSLEGKNKRDNVMRECYDSLLRS